MLATLSRRPRLRCHPMLTGLWLAGLCACSTPLAPPVARAPVPALRTAPLAEPSAVPTVPAVPAAVASSPAAPPAAPYSAAVAARFPEPAVAYDTPAFEPGRSSFTSNAELQSALLALVQEASAANGQTHVKLLGLGGLELVRSQGTVAIIAGVSSSVRERRSRSTAPRPVLNRPGFSRPRFDVARFSPR